MTEDLPLYALNYLIQRAFGFLNCHLHKFNLPEEEVLRLTESKKEKWEQLVGTLFRSPLMSEEDIFWADDYKEGSIKNWLRSKYTDPQPSKAYGESYVSCQRDIKELKEGRFRQHYEPTSYEMLPRLFELDPFSLLERLSIGDVFEIASEFHYTYDFGDDWTFRITSLGPVEQCISQGLLTENKFLKCVEKMEKTHRPVMLAHDGVMLIEDVGGINGFCDFLELSHRDPPDDESATWHSSGPLGRSGRGKLRVGYQLAIKTSSSGRGLLFLMFMRINTLTRTNSVSRTNLRRVKI